VFSDRDLEPYGVHTLDVAKRLLDYGFYAPTIYFPLVVPGALMIEPTETESRETLDRFVEVMTELLGKARTDPEWMKGAPYGTPVRRLDDVRAARDLDLAYVPAAVVDDAPGGVPLAQQSHI
jgi:glycine dehydrogenase subunit 2